MSYIKKTWSDRQSEHPSRRTLTDVNTGTVQTVEVNRAEGEVTEEGEAFSAENMNDLENRINNAFGNCSFSVQSDGAYVSYNLNGTYVSKKLGEATLNGTAVASDVLAGKTFYNTSSDSSVSGSMTNNAGSTVTARSMSISGSYVTLTVPSNGYYSSSSKVKAQISNYSGETVSTNGVTQDDDYAYFTVPIEGYYTTSSKVKASNNYLTRTKTFTMGSITSGEESITIGSGAKSIIMKMKNTTSSYKNVSFIYNGATWDYMAENQAGGTSSVFNASNSSSNFNAFVPYYTNGVLKYKTGTGALNYGAVFDVIVGW